MGIVGERPGGGCAKLGRGKVAGRLAAASLAGGAECAAIIVKRSQSSHTVAPTVRLGYSAIKVHSRGEIKMSARWTGSTYHTIPLDPTRLFTVL